MITGTLSGHEDGKPSRCIRTSGEAITASMSDETGRVLTLVLNAKGEGALAVSYPSRSDTLTIAITPDGLFSVDL